MNLDLRAYRGALVPLWWEIQFKGRMHSKSDPQNLERGGWNDSVLGAGCVGVSPERHSGPTRGIGWIPQGVVSTVADLNGQLRCAALESYYSVQGRSMVVNNYGTDSVKGAPIEH